MVALTGMTWRKIGLNSIPMTGDQTQLDSDTRAPAPSTPQRPFWRASVAALFLPALVVAVGYAALWLYLVQIGRGSDNLARVSLAVLAIGVPCLLAYAGLRWTTTRLTLRGSHLEAHPGFPARDPVVVAYASISGLRIRRGLSGRLTGAGSLIIEREPEASVVVSGLTDPDAALMETTRRAPQLAGSANLS